MRITSVQAKPHPSHAVDGPSIITLRYPCRSLRIEETTQRWDYLFQIYRNMKVLTILMSRLSLAPYRPPRMVHSELEGRQTLASNCRYEANWESSLPYFDSSASWVDIFYTSIWRSRHRGTARSFKASLLPLPDDTPKMDGSQRPLTVTHVCSKNRANCCSRIKLTYTNIAFGGYHLTRPQPKPIEALLTRETYSGKLK